MKYILYLLILCSISWSKDDVVTKLESINLTVEDSAKLSAMQERISALTAEFNQAVEAARWHACLVAGVTIGECGKVRPNGTVERLPIKEIETKEKK